MNKRQKEVLQAGLDNEKEVLKALEKNYTKALADIKKNIRELQAMPETQSKAYQIEFQKQLESQISAYLDVLKGNNYKTITEYMNTCYEEGFAGSLYSLQGFGESITIPIDQEAVIQAVKMTGDDLKLSEKLEGNTKLLKQNVLAEMQRGFASELSYADIARNISNWGNADMNRSMRIARTEGHRVQCQADMDCAYKARELGCDTVKQWNAALDGKTRESHQRVDKEWRELDEPFSNGLMYPGDPNGKAAEVVNCRCSLDDVPRWYVESGGGQYRRNNITGEIIECMNYAEFKEKYLQMLQDGAIMMTRNLDRKTANTGAFSNLKVAMQKREVKRVCEKYGFEIKGLTIKIQRSETFLSTSFYGSADYNNIGRIDLFPNAFINEEELIKTIIHENCHVEQLRKYGKKYCQEHLSDMEEEAYKVQDEVFEQLKKGVK